MYEKRRQETLNKREDILCSWTGGTDVKMAVFSKLIYRFNAILIKILVAFFTEIDNLMLNLIWKCMRPRKATTILKKNKAGALNFISKFATKLQ